MANDHVIVMCPPHSDYPEAPKDQSKSELRECPKCKNQMWLSDKKKGVLMFSSCIGREIVLACYHCITKMAEKDPSMFLFSKKMDL